MKQRIPLSVAIITRNEASNLPGCIGSVRFADQIVVVDSESTDDTVRIASELGCEVHSESWKGFGLQKQSAVDKCRHPWVLVLDADERIPRETAEVIAKIVSREAGDIAGYRFPRKNFFQGRWIRHLWGNDRIVRLFRKDRGRMSPAMVHESVEVEGPVKDLSAPIEHFTGGSLSDMLGKIDHYSTLGAREAFREGRRASVWSAMLRACAAFLQSYIAKRGFLDGYQGLILSVTEFVNKFFKYAKLDELHRGVRRKHQDSRKKQTD